MAVDQQFKQLLQEHGSMIERIVSSHERRPALAQELVQEAAFATWRALPNFRGDSSLKAFVARITHNVCVSHVRKEVQFEQQDLPQELIDPAQRPEENVDANHQRTLLLRAVQTLPINLRTVITLHLEGFSNVDIANALSIKVNNVGVRLNRGKAQLKAQMRKYHD